MIWRLRNEEPSFSSMNEKSFESRRVRTQPWTWRPEIGAVRASAALTEMGPGMGLNVAGDWRFDKRVVATALYRRKRVAIAIDAFGRRQSAVATTRNSDFRNGIRV